MGFRSTFVTSDHSIKWPDWLKEKYKDSVNFDLCASSKKEAKFYGCWSNLIQDFHKALHDIDFYNDAYNDGHLHFTISILHECDGVTRYQLYKDKIICSEPVPFDCWEEKDGITHNYCYDCQRTIGTQLEQLLQKYKDENYDFHGMKLVSDTALRIVQAMPNCQVRDFLYTLVLKHLKEEASNV